MEHLILVNPIIPSLLSANLTCLGEAIQTVVNAGIEMIHLDAMDNHYVPNLTFGPSLCQSIHEHFPDLPIDVHLMATPVDLLIQQFAKAGAKRLSIHPDATIHLDRSLQLIKDQGCEAGLVLNPAVSPESLRWCAHRLDFVLVMTVNPGFGGQTLMPEMLEKIALIHQNYPTLPICVDGGILPTNIGALAHAGASQFIAGSSVFNHDSPENNITALLAAIKHPESS